MTIQLVDRTKFMKHFFEIINSGQDFELGDYSGTVRTWKTTNERLQSALDSTSFTVLAPTHDDRPVVNIPLLGKFKVGLIPNPDKIAYIIVHYSQHTSPSPYKITFEVYGNKYQELVTTWAEKIERLGVNVVLKVLATPETGRYE